MDGWSLPKAFAPLSMPLIGVGLDDNALVEGWTLAMVSTSNYPNAEEVDIRSSIYYKCPQMSTHVQHKCVILRYSYS